MSPAPQDPAGLIRNGKLLGSEFRVCTDPDLLDEHARLTAARILIVEAGADSMAGADTTEVDAQLADVQEHIDAATVTLQLRALGRRPFGALRDEHPARKADDGTVLPADQRLGVNGATFWDPFVRRSIVSPVLDDDTLTLLIEEKLTDAQWSDLTTLCWNLNETRVRVPFSPPASPSRTASEPK